MTIAASPPGFPVRALPFAGFFLLLAPAAMGGALAAAPLVALTGLLAYPWPRLLAQARNAAPLLLALGAFAAWAGAACVWSPSPNALVQFAKVVGMAAAGMLLVAAATGRAEHQRFIGFAGMIGAGLLAALLAVEFAADMPLNRLFQPDAATGDLMRNPGAGALVLVFLTLGVMAACVGAESWRRLAWRALALATLFLGLQFATAANGVAFAAAIGAFLFGYASPRIAFPTIAVLLAVWMLAAPWVSPILADQQALIERMPDSWAIRTVIWDHAAALVREQPMLGHGFDASRTFEGESALRGVTFELIPLHPHSVSLQIWLELGGVGAALAALALVIGGLAGARAARGDPNVSAGACAVLTAAGVVANVSYGAWQEWLIAVFFTGAALVAAARQDDAA
ncbi:MAG: hypothetical protein GC206_05385 [Alphaproteobacteria bacterium]|nr:hypothetical protein [Alphaproteobacteria bacterium]